MSDNLCPESEDGTSKEIVIVGDGDNSKAIPFQVVQGIYNELTGKTETVKKTYKKLFRIEFVDIEQLHKKIGQACEQFHIKASSHSISVYYLDNTKEDFTSFDRFRLHCGASASAVESVYLKYNFLIVLPQAQKPQSYTVSVRLVSQITVSKSMDDDFLGSPPRFLKLMGQYTAIATVRYVDYAVARNFMTLFDDWFKGLPCAKEKKSVRWIQNRPYLIIRFAKFFATIFVACLTLFYFQKLSFLAIGDLKQFGTFFIWAASMAYIVVNLSTWSAGIIESAIESWSEISYICITKGDERAIDDANTNNRRALLKGVVGLLVTFSISLIASLVANQLTPQPR